MSSLTTEISKEIRDFKNRMEYLISQHESPSWEKYDVKIATKSLFTKIDSTLVKLENGGNSIPKIEKIIRTKNSQLIADYIRTPPQEKFDTGKFKRDEYNERNEYI